MEVLPLIFITGASGFIGFEVAFQALHAGYRLRLSVREHGSIPKLQQALSGHSDRVEFVVVPDITVPGCFDRFLHGATYVIHVASPLAFAGGDIYTPAVRGTKSILSAALQVNTIKRVVLTSSALALIPGDHRRDGLVVSEQTELDEAIDPALIPSLDPRAQYRAGKLAAHRATLEFASDHDPHFNIIMLYPTFVFGPNRLQQSASELAGTNALLFFTLMSEHPKGGQFLGAHIEDVAKAHIRALGYAAPGVSGFLLSGKRRSWSDVCKFVREEFPTMKLKLQPRDWENYTVDTSQAEKCLGLSFRPMEDQVRDLLQQQLSFREL
ncbi:hypothetical protein BDV32DRAFT_159234 [Aspergillus pseudonomiae]|uniref:NAD-dependent epimerase/dehydratase domain-containing protein n=1 Tax=Aspergillus pseudonomiae TaxID=1506151 RepID=A0A5N7DDW6_9EURO|nr:uncharacterized protein BDV37DRAFT_282924 [Aspergillus pseudonomiae]KAB8259463.1 hypothetical protein BDV32DRAFT_159234 [Aspergillus pseudonomiae]KAE8404375.1 hypothetical protein BDV37DRAFT_282924 [Aspergillus pseudonomiae]